ncbi:MAG: DUF1330 domain-containing protein [Gammaproteobacteria bacterium]|nr:DUF1330 domain-containing protein [Gammaproteobacteria bacterium]
MLRALLVTLLFGGLPAKTLADEPPGYIFVTGWYKDLGVQRTYNQAVGPVLRQYGYETAVQGMPGRNLQVLEGDWTPRMALLIKFTSEDHAKDFWWSDAYREVKAIRQEVSAVDIVQVDGVPGVAPRLDGASAYLVFFGEIHDTARLASEYGPFASQVVRDHGGRYLVRAGRADIELLEGAFGNVNLVILEFASGDDLNAFWNDTRYQRLSEIRRATGRWSVVQIVSAGD